jgi:hypothetical protein
MDEFLHEGALQVRGAQGLKLNLSIEVSPEGGISSQRIEETRMALQELGLSSNLETH